MSPLIFVTFCLVFVNLGEALQCKDDNNQAVDWYVMYKLNKMDQSSLPLAKTGRLYAYITSATLAHGWQLTTKGVDSRTSMLANTLAPLYDRETLLNSSTILYSDSSPYVGGTRGDRGHSKGVFMTNADDGFWLVHSVPGFPDSAGGGYSFPDSGTRHAQSFLCLSINANQVETIARQFQFNEIISYFYYSKPALHQLYPTLTSMKSIRKPPYNNKAIITTSAGVQFVSFAKSGKWQKDLYDWVGAQLGSDIYVQSWRNGPQKIGNDCQGYHVYNINSVVLRVNDMTFGVRHSEDHSKWAVSKRSTGPGGNWVCIGDINRAATQFSRGGGTVCVNLPQLWVAWKNLVNEVQQCPPH